MSNTSGGGESLYPMDTNPEAWEFYELLEGAFLGIKGQVQKICGRMDKIMPLLEEQNQQIREKIIESQILAESQEETEDSKDYMLPLKDYDEDDLDCGDDLEIPLSGGVFVTRRILSAQGMEDELPQ